MKKLFATATLALLFSACSKEPTPSTPAQEPVTTFKFTANGILYELNGSLATYSSMGSIIRRGGDLNTGQYSLLAQNGAARNTMVLPLTVGTLTSTTYTFPNGGAGECELIGVSYYGDKAGDNSTVTISSIHDGVYADGIFSGQHTKTGTTQKVIITNGEFKNVKILL